MTQLLAVLTIVGKVFDKLPDYIQKKKNKFYKLYREYEYEISKEYHKRDDARIDELTIELHALIVSFGDEIRKEDTKTV